VAVAGQESISAQICCGIIISNPIIVKRRKYLPFINLIDEEGL
jgi:hypothetical protein